MSSSPAAGAWSSFVVDDLPPVEEGHATISSERYTVVFNLVQSGNRAFRDGRFEESITLYSKAQQSKPGDPLILKNRSAAFCRISQILRDRSSVESDHQPLNGLDPTVHAELALKDAEKVASIAGNDLKSYFLKASAFILLERYEDAREALISGLQVDPFSNLLQNALKDLEKIPVKHTKHLKLQRTDEFECTLCLKLLYEPVTTPCGHSFCRFCLLQAMDHGNKCPMCRTILFINPRSYPVSVTLKNIIQNSFSEEYAERTAEHQSMTLPGVDRMPLFMMDVVIPCQKLALNIFEPRYRLMVRRIMEGNHRMGMVGFDSETGTIADFACEVEITECEPLPDGRFYLEVEGRRRFHILRSWDQDGYRVAEVEWVEDFQPTTQERKDLQQMARDAAELARTWISSNAREASQIGRRPRGMELLQTEGMPRPQDSERLSFWIINLLNLGPTEKLVLLQSRDTRERLTRGIISLKAEVDGCRVQ